jgi:hypothetical protein
MAGVDRLEAEDVAQESADLISVIGVDDGVETGDHDDGIVTREGIW